MHNLSALIGDYMAFRSARGFQPSPKTEHLLRQFVGSLPARREDGLLFGNADALVWANAPANVSASWASDRLSVVRQFARYLAGSGLLVMVPSGRQVPTASRRAIPYLYSDSDIQALMKAAEALFTPLRAGTMRTLVGLLAVTGMRIGETLQMRIGDIDHDRGILTIRHAKLGRERIVHIDSSTSQALLAYLGSSARRGLGTDQIRPLFVTSKGTAMCYSNACGAFHRMTQHAGLVPRAGARPRLHDLRHSFATKTMIDAYRTGRDPGQTFAALAIWLGHSNPADTYWYLQAAPEVAAIAAWRLEHDQEA